MAKPWDDLMKRLFIASSQQMVQWLIPGAQFIGERSLELKNRTIEADILYNIVVNGEEMVLHVEFQRRGDHGMGKRLWEYNALATIASDLPVCSIVIYLKKVKSVVEPPYKMALPNREVSHVFFFKNIKLWEIPTQVFQQPGVEGLLPLLPLTRDGARREVVEEMIVRLLTTQKMELLSLGYIVAALVLKKNDEREWLNRRFGMLKDILKESWAYQDILREGLEEGIERGIEQGIEQGTKRGIERGIKQGIEQGIEQGQRKERQAVLKRWRQKLIRSVGNRFPEVASLVRKQVKAIDDPLALEELMFDLFSAKTVEEARQCLLMLENDNASKKD